MNPGGKEAALSHASYWNEHYSEAYGKDTPTHEWYQNFASLEPFFSKYLFHVRGPQSNPKILHIGSGDSTIPLDLLKQGYKTQICMDFSPTIVELMKSRHSDEGIEWVTGDVREMSVIPSQSIDVAFDKGTLDAMTYGNLWNPSDEVMQNTGKYIYEVLRVLKDDGFFLFVTYLQPHFVEPLLNRNKEWDVKMETFGDGNSFDYFGFILKKS